jgi:hypothetical protein
MTAPTLADPAVLRCGAIAAVIRVEAAYDWLDALDRWMDLPPGADRHGCWVERTGALDARLDEFAGKAAG